MLPQTLLSSAVSWFTTKLMAPFVARLLASYLTTLLNSDWLSGIGSQMFPSLFPSPKTPAENFMSGCFSALGNQMFPNLFPRQAPPENFLSGLFQGQGNVLGHGNLMIWKLFIHETLPEDPDSRQSILSWLMTTLMSWLRKRLAPFLLLSVVLVVGYYLYKKKVCKRGQQPEKKSRIEVEVNITVNVNVQVQSLPARNWSPTVNVQNGLVNPRSYDAQK